MTIAVEEVSGLAFFRGLTPEGTACFVDAAQVRAWPRRTVIFRQGEESHSAYVILQGRVDIRVLLPDGTEMTIDVLGPGDAFGLAGLAHIPRISTALAVRASRLLEIPTHRLRNLAHEHPHLLLSVTEHLVRRLSRALQEQAATGSQRVYARVAVKLLSLAETDETGERRVPEKLSHSDLASMVGSTRATVTRVLQELRRRGLVDVDPRTGHLIICEAGTLTDLADAEAFSTPREGTILP